VEKRRRRGRPADQHRRLVDDRGERRSGPALHERIERIAKRLPGGYVRAEVHAIKGTRPAFAGTRKTEARPNASSAHRPPVPWRRSAHLGRRRRIASIGVTVPVGAVCWRTASTVVAFSYSPASTASLIASRSASSLVNGRPGGGSAVG